ncbi:hypothetical protein NLG97_g9459 [Lecanicillium saksenae]|uniref:Uncharacterized protein n=1 Tax=Lecanicillium saksenae TaxID=468837 RepID=A0ACC1QJW1_9HYPO|nr:hypothetical protein NLG97_g9459 [Lecanicillium saksenae]
MFTLFPNLPTELRLFIWELCLPRRVVEEPLVHEFLLDRDCECRDLGPKRRSSEPPAILSVSREAAQVARENGSLVTLDRSYLSGPTWIQPGRDRVLHRNGHEDRRPYRTPKTFFELTRSLGMEPSLTAKDLVPGSLEKMFTLEGDTRYLLHPHVVWVRSGDSRRSTVVEHLIELEAAGDRSLLISIALQLVDVGDHARLLAYSDLVRDHSELSSDKTARVRRILYEFRDTTEVPDRLREWQEALGWMVLAHMWERDRVTLLEANPQFGTTQSPQEQEFNSAWSPSYYREPSLRRGIHRVNETNAWVIQARKTMWRPKLQVIIRLCRGESRREDQNH